LPEFPLRGGKWTRWRSPQSFALVAKGSMVNYREIEVVEYDPNWAIKFDIEREILQEALGSNAVNIEHIGSTAVFGLAAKPVIDILVQVSSLKILDANDDKNWISRV